MATEDEEAYEREKRRERQNREWMLRGSDELAPQHTAVHAALVRWGLYGKQRYQPGTCNSIEKFYTKGGDVTPASTAPAPANPMILAVDRVVRLMVVDVPKHGTTVVMYYLQRRAPATICCSLKPTKIRFEDFSTWMFDCRAMVVNRLRREGVDIE